ncbi:MAG TPA: dTDP-4-dehydrorhamnose 3,5-epimerase [Gemmatimonadales bacterium]|nr:dTDP-4-dehydrorhamnose 3,5-epimerase [Gemmatimonadales bacterium]
MIFTRTPLPGAVVVDLDRREDERGFFARSFCQREFEAEGLEPTMAQCNVSFNRRKHTLRGMHWQVAPHGEAKLVRVTRGAIWDAIVDLRPESPTYCRWFGVELTAENRRALYIPRDFAHGFVTLTGDVEVFYQMSTFYVGGAQTGARWNDPAFGIQWPVAEPFMSERDATYPDFPRRIPA